MTDPLPQNNHYNIHLQPMHMPLQYHLPRSNNIYNKTASVTTVASHPTTTSTTTGKHNRSKHSGRRHPISHCNGRRCLSLCNISRNFSSHCNSSKCPNSHSNSNNTTSHSQWADSTSRHLDYTLLNSSNPPNHRIWVLPWRITSKTSTPCTKLALLPYSARAEHMTPPLAPKFTWPP